MPSEEMFEVPGDRLRELTSNIEMLGRDLQSANAAIMSMRVTIDNYISERDKVVAELTKVFLSHLTRHKETPGEDWDPEWLNVVCIHLPTGQATWHIHISETAWFAHLNGVELECKGYDGYSTPEKYQRLFRLPVLWLKGFYIEKHLENEQSARIDSPGPDDPGVSDTRPGS